MSFIRSLLNYILPFIRFTKRVWKKEIASILSTVFVGDKLTHEYIEHFSTLHHMEIEETSIDVKQVDYNTLMFWTWILDKSIWMWIGLLEEW